MLFVIFGVRAYASPRAPSFEIMKIQPCILYAIVLSLYSGSLVKCGYLCLLLVSLFSRHYATMYRLDNVNTNTLSENSSIVSPLYGLPTEAPAFTWNVICPVQYNSSVREKEPQETSK